MFEIYSCECTQTVIISCILQCCCETRAPALSHHGCIHFTNFNTGLYLNFMTHDLNRIQSVAFLDFVSTNQFSSTTIKPIVYVQRSFRWKWNKRNNYDGNKMFASIPLGLFFSTLTINCVVCLIDGNYTHTNCAILLGFRKFLFLFHIQREMSISMNRLSKKFISNKNDEWYTLAQFN